MDSYCIKDGYKSNSANLTLDTNDSTYWTEERIRASHYYQYHVYIFARRLIKKKKIKNVLDIGCGPGTKLMELIYPYCSEVVGIDQPNAIAVCKNKYSNGIFFADNFESPAIKLNKNFDLIICCDVIEHLLDPDVLLNYIKKISNNYSTIIFSTPERDILRGVDCLESPKSEHVREWNQTEFTNYITSRGYVVEQAKLVPPMKFSFSKEYFLFLKRVAKGVHRFKTCQFVVTHLA